MAAPDLKKAGATAVAELAKSAAELIAISKKWRKIRVDQQKASQAIYDKGVKANSPAEMKKAQLLGDQLEVLMHKNRDLTLAEYNKWMLLVSDTKKMIDELPDRIGDRFQLVIDKAVPGLKAALKKQAKEREKLILDSLKASGLV